MNGTYESGENLDLAVRLVLDLDLDDAGHLVVVYFDLLDVLEGKLYHLGLGLALERARLQFEAGRREHDYDVAVLARVARTVREHGLAVVVACRVDLLHVVEILLGVGQLLQI